MFLVRDFLSDEVMAAVSILLSHVITLMERNFPTHTEWSCMAGPHLKVKHDRPALKGIFWFITKFIADILNMVTSLKRSQTGQQTDRRLDKLVSQRRK